MLANLFRKKFLEEAAPREDNADVRSVLSSSMFTASSSRTVPGIGSLSGKALYGFGKATLKGVEQVVISRKLTQMASRFPHTDTSDKKDWPNVYDELLELTRPGLYGPETRRKAQNLVRVQIQSGYTEQLIAILHKWHTIEVQFFLSEMSCVMTGTRWIPEVLDSDRNFVVEPAHVKAPSIYAISLGQTISRESKHATAAFWGFVGRLVVPGSVGAVAALRTNCLDIILWALIHDDEQAMGEMDSMKSSEAQLACSALLHTLPQCSVFERCRSVYPLLQFWDAGKPVVYTIEEYPFDSRRRAWLSLDPSVAKRRLGVIHDWCTFPHSSSTAQMEMELSHNIADLVELSLFSDLASTSQSAGITLVLMLLVQHSVPSERVHVCFSRCISKDDLPLLWNFIMHNEHTWLSNPLDATEAWSHQYVRFWSHSNKQDPRLVSEHFVKALVDGMMCSEAVRPQLLEAAGAYLCFFEDRQTLDASGSTTWIPFPGSDYVSLETLADFRVEHPTASDVLMSPTPSTTPRSPPAMSISPRLSSFTSPGGPSPMQKHLMCYALDYLIEVANIHRNPFMKRGDAKALKRKLKLVDPRKKHSAQLAKRRQSHPAIEPAMAGFNGLWLGNG